MYIIIIINYVLLLLIVSLVSRRIDLVWRTTSVGVPKTDVCATTTHKFGVGRTKTSFSEEWRSKSWTINNTCSVRDVSGGIITHETLRWRRDSGRTLDSATAATALDDTVTAAAIAASETTLTAMVTHRKTTVAFLI